MNKLPKLIKMTIATLCFLLVIQVVVANRLTTAGLTLKTLLDNEQNLGDENETLETRIASSSSIIQVSERAGKSGFIKATAFYLTFSLPVALENSNTNVAR